MRLYGFDADITPKGDRAMYELIASRMIEGGPLYDLGDDRAHRHPTLTTVEAHSERRRTHLSLLDRLGLPRLALSGRDRIDVCPSTCPAC
jgi:hypothetical protein